MHNHNMVKTFFVVCLFIFLPNLYHCQYGSNTVEGRYIFIDGGAHLGETIKAFKKSALYSEHQWKIFSFECNPFLVQRIPKGEDVVVIDKAMWIHNKGLKFHFGKSSLGGNVVKNQYSAEKEKSIHVESVNFGQWLRKNFKRRDIIYVKLDIEGAEYTILDKMLQDGSIQYIDKLYVEFHSFIMEDVSKEKDKELIDQIERLGISVVTKAPGSREGDYF